nr:Scavenger mRNA decapping enzyme C-term binding [uncultured bacterium]
MTDKGYNIDAGRTAHQIQRMKELTDAGKCFMCYENLVDYDLNEILFETKHWVITPNAYPYEHTSLHLVLISRRHVRSMAELNAEEQADLGVAAAQIERKHNLDSYFLGMRNGDFRYNGGTVEHLHGHIIVGDRNPDTFEKVRMKVSSLPKK